jgi:hypothetical protein
MTKLDKVFAAVTDWLAAEKERDYLFQEKLYDTPEEFNKNKTDSLADVRVKQDSWRVTITYDGAGYDQLTYNRYENHYSYWLEFKAEARAMGTDVSQWEFKRPEEDERSRLDAAVHAIDKHFVVEDNNNWSCSVYVG